MKLDELRSEWEKGAKVLLVLPRKQNDYITIFVILERNNKYSLHRYFKIVDDWEISVDLRDQVNFVMIFLRLNQNFVTNLDQ